MSGIPTGEDVQYLMDYFENVYVDNDKVVSITLGLIEHYDVSEVTDENRVIEIKQLQAQLKEAEQTINEQKEVIEGLKKNKLDHNPQHESVDAFWKKWEEVGEPHKHGVYESTWMAFNSAVEALEVKDECDHEWVSADNQVIKGAEICTKCFTLRAIEVKALNKGDSDGDK